MTKDNDREETRNHGIYVAQMMRDNRLGGHELTVDDVRAVLATFDDSVDPTANMEEELHTQFITPFVEDEERRNATMSPLERTHTTRDYVRGLTRQFYDQFRAVADLELSTDYQPPEHLQNFADHPIDANTRRFNHEVDYWRTRGTGAARTWYNISNSPGYRTMSSKLADMAAGMRDGTGPNHPTDIADRLRDILGEDAVTLTPLESYEGTYWEEEHYNLSVKGCFNAHMGTHGDEVRVHFEGDEFEMFSFDDTYREDFTRDVVGLIMDGIGGHMNRKHDCTGNETTTTDQVRPVTSQGCTDFAVIGVRRIDPIRENPYCDNATEHGVVPYELECMFGEEKKIVRTVLPLGVPVTHGSAMMAIATDDKLGHLLPHTLTDQGRTMYRRVGHHGAVQFSAGQAALADQRHDAALIAAGIDPSDHVEKMKGRHRAAMTAKALDALERLGATTPAAEAKAAVEDPQMR